MADAQGPPVVSRMREVLTWILERVGAFPRSQRFLLGQRIGDLAMDVLERLLEAAYSREKEASLRRANLELEKLRHLLRSACELKCLSLRQYEYASRNVDEVGRMIGGWIRQQARSG